MKNLRKVLLGLLALMMAVSLPGLAIPAAAEEAEQTTTGREERNFNRSWKFVRRDEDNAMNVEYNDDNWYNVGLPHDFSIPYFQETKHYTGIGWYRKEFSLTAEELQRTIKLEFDGVFHTIDLYVNGQHVMQHKGGYTGFECNISDYVQEGNNVLAARVSNIWDPELAPRSGEHNFTGGIYRDVRMILEDPVHITWYGTYATTPNISAAASDLKMEAEVENLEEDARTVFVRHTLLDADRKEVCQFASEEQILAPGEIHTFRDTYQNIPAPHLWSVEDPYLYTVKTDVFSNSTLVDSVETTMGFRWMTWDAKEGFFLNGEHLWLNGANAHQDHAGWANAVSDSALYRDVEMIKEAGMNFIRGSHYPHAPIYSRACDELGIIFWSEAPFWFSGGTSGEGGAGDSSDYMHSGYPTKVEYQAAFEQSCLDAVEDMIRIHRNHPSIAVWSMGNECFFSDTQDDSGADLHEKKKNLITRMARKAKELDPTRAVGLGGTQRSGYDRIEGIEVAGYNGDGASISSYQDPGIPNMVAEYGSHTANRSENDGYRIYYDHVQNDGNGNAIEYSWRSGISLWCAFHHGSLAARSYGDMGIVDYYRLPLKAWYYYRNKYNPEHPEPEFSTTGTPVKVSLEASNEQISDDGTQDTHLVATLVDGEGNWIGEKRKITLRVVSGPGVFPTGKTFILDPDNENKSMLDGKGAIEFRSYYAGTTVIEASAEGLESSTVEITTTGSSQEEKEPAIETLYGSFMNTSGIVLTDIEEAPAYELRTLTGVPCIASSNDQLREKVLDQDPSTSWVAAESGPGEYVDVTMEHGEVILYRASVLFDGEKLPFTLQGKGADEEEWTTLVSYDASTIQNAPKQEIFLGTRPFRNIRVLFDQLSEEQTAQFAELKIWSLKSVDQPILTGYQYLSDLELPDGVLKNVLANQSAIVIDGTRYKKGITLQGEQELVIDNFSEEQGGYGALETLAYNGSSASMKLQLEARGQIILDKSLQAGEVLPLCLSLWKCPDLTIRTEGNGSITLADARLTGVLRNVSSAEVKASFIGAYESLVPGTTFSGTLKMTAENDHEARAVLQLLDETGRLLDLVSQPVELKADETTKADISMRIPEDLQEGSTLRLFVYDSASLDLLSDVIYSTTLAGAEEGKYPQEEAPVFTLPEKTTLVYGKEMEQTGEWGYWTPANGSLSGYETFVESGNWQNTALSHTFMGKQVTVYAKKDGSQKGAEVWIDDELKTTIITTASSGNTYEAVYTSELMDNGKHTIRLVPVGKFGFDALSILSNDITPECPADADLLDTQADVVGKDESLIKSGSWAYWNTSSVDCGYETYTNKAGDTLRLTFTGTGLSLVAKVDGSKTGAEIRVDGKLLAAVNTKGSPDAYTEVFSTDALPFGEHVVEIRTLGAFGFEKIVTRYGHPEDRSLLESLAAQAKELQEEDYSSGFEALQTALSRALLMLESFSYSQDEIDEAASELSLAIDQLVPVVQTGQTALRAALKQALDVIETKNYDPQSEQLNAFITVFQEASSLLHDRNATEDEGDDLAEKLEEALAAIARAPESEADKTLLDMALAMAHSLDTPENLDGVNELVVRYFHTCIEQAEAVMADASATSEEVNTAWLNLTRAIQMLSFKTDKTELEALKAECETLLARAPQDCAEAQQMKEALEFAQSVLDDPAALTEVSIQQAIDQLKAAREALLQVLDLDTSLLAWLLTATQDLNESLYLRAGLDALHEAQEQAAQVLADPQSEERIAQALNSLHQAWLNLRFKASESLLEKLAETKVQLLSLSLEFVPEEMKLAVCSLDEELTTLLEADEVDQAKARDVLNKTENLIASIETFNKEHNPEEKEPQQTPALSKQDKPAAAARPIVTAEEKTEETTRQSAQPARSVKTASAFHPGLLMMTALGAVTLTLLMKRKDHLK